MCIHLFPHVGKSKILKQCKLLPSFTALVSFLSMLKHHWHSLHVLLFVISKDAMFQCHVKSKGKLEDFKLNQRRSRHFSSFSTIF
ncbi:hypothetical protein GDO81_028052 [Engystomops pustulosus]|uniref:Uncharacterized protein n=1 Tax=Engystomops pustulosus TaxID=76066 RepID=A0AAV6YDP4_ENGPU|nr:hypothetical protein GDO81_028052 [Engystomops pustulosus]